MENNIGRMLSDDELAEVSVSPKTRDADRKLSDLNVHIKPSSLSDPNIVQVLKNLQSPVNAVADPSSSSDLHASSDLSVDADPSSFSDLHNVQGNKITDSWSSLFQKNTNRSRDLQRHSNLSADPDHHIMFDDDDAFAAV